MVIRKVVDDFKSNIVNIYGQDGVKFLSLLPQKIKYIAELWKLENLKPLNNMSHNYILSGYCNNSPIILKISFEAADIRREAEALKFFGNHGAVKVIDYQAEYLLLEKILPGYSLKTYLPSQRKQALDIILEIIKHLHIPVNKLSSSVSFPHIKEQLQILYFILHKYESNSHSLFDIEFLFYLQKAVALKNKLIINTLPEVLIHGDLHHDNILWNGRNWQVIDPKGVIGYQFNEFWAFIINIEEDTKFIADSFNIDVQLIREWYFVDLVLRICWHMENNTSPILFFKLAKETFNLLQNMEIFLFK